MDYDVLVVGCSLAGIAYCDILEQNDLSFKVFDDNSQQSSKVAAGLYNPVILKRFSKVWEVKSQLDIALPFYERIEHTLSKTFDYKTPIYRLFHSVEEQNLWFEASDKPDLAPYMSLNLLNNSNANINAPFGFGKVNQCGRLDTDYFIKLYREYLNEKELFINERFDYSSVEITSNGINYKGVSAKKIVFCEGYGVLQNPFFNYLPLNGTKGELITIHAPDLKLNQIIKSAVFVIPLGDDLYSVGSTYAWDDKTGLPTEGAREELESKLKRFIKCDYKVVKHVAGIRPTVKDRRPLVGQHPKHEHLYILNGLGTRGVLIGPYVALHLFNAIYKNIPLESELSIGRFRALYQDL
jgi:glycine/D-amino acid oxidase-like deaminating enzyme